MNFIQKRTMLIDLINNGLLLDTSCIQLADFLKNIFSPIKNEILHQFFIQPIVQCNEVSFVLSLTHLLGFDPRFFQLSMYSDAMVSSHLQPQVILMQVC